METVILVPLIIGTVEVVKRTKIVGDNFIPLVAILIGVTISLTDGLTTNNALNGLIAALIASGLYDNTVKGIKAVKEIDLIR